MKYTKELVRGAFQKFRSKRLSILLIILLLSGLMLTLFYFGFIRPRLIIKSCTFQFVSISVHSYDSKAVVFRLLINISNPDWQSAQLDPASFDVISADFTEPVAQGWTEEAYSIPSCGSSVVTLFLRVYNSPMLGTVLENFLGLKKAEFTISGFMTVTSLMNLKFSFTLKQTFEMKRNLLDMVEIAGIKAMAPGTRFNVTMRLDNPLDIPIDISSLAFDVFNESRAYILEGSLPSPLRIPPSGQADASISIDVKKTEFEWLVGTLLSEGNVSLLIQGNVSATIFTLNAFLMFNQSRTFSSTWGTEIETNMTSVGPIRRDSDSVAFEVPIKVKSPIECSVSSIRFELYDRLSSYVGFGYASYEPPFLLLANQEEWLYISINMTLSAFRSLVVQIALGEPVNLQIRNGVISILVYQTTYSIHFEKEIK